MRSYEERCAEVKRRIAAEKRKKRLRRGRLETHAASRQTAADTAAAACLALLAGVSIAMPGMTAQLQPDSCTGFETAASMYGGGDALGYIIVGLLAFLLGVCMTILCFRLRQMERDEKDEGQHGAD